MARGPKAAAAVQPDQAQPDQAPAATGAADDGDAIMVRLDEVLAERDMTLTELADHVGITIVNLSILKNGRARAIRFSTLARLCAELGCQPGDLLRFEPGSPGSHSGPAHR